MIKVRKYKEKNKAKFRLQRHRNSFNTNHICYGQIMEIYGIS